MGTGLSGNGATCTRTPHARAYARTHAQHTRSTHVHAPRGAVDACTDGTQRPWTLDRGIATDARLRSHAPAQAAPSIAFGCCCMAGAAVGAVSFAWTSVQTVAARGTWRRSERAQSSTRPARNPPLPPLDAPLPDTLNATPGSPRLSFSRAYSLRLVGGVGGGGGGGWGGVACRLLFSALLRWRLRIARCSVAALQHCALQRCALQRCALQRCALQLGVDVLGSGVAAAAQAPPATSGR